MPIVGLFNKEGQKVGDFNLSEEIFGFEINTNALHQVVVAQLANKRQGTQSAKTRAEVSGGGKKPWFYSEITFKPDEMAENMHKSSGFIPGIRPGEPTARYIERILTKVAIIAGLFAAVIATFPVIMAGYTPFKGISFGGTSILIMVGVALETMRQIESQLVMRHYEGFLK